MIDLLKIGPPSWFGFCPYQMFEIELVTKNLWLIWNVFSNKPDVIDWNRPCSMREKYFGIKYLLEKSDR